MSETRPFQFFRAGGFDQVRFDSGADLLALDKLDQKLWVALACPIKGLNLDPRTLALIDTENNGRIRASELTAAVKWAGAMLKDANTLLAAPDPLPLSAINVEVADGKNIFEAAKTVLRQLGKADATAISVADSATAVKTFNELPFNGDGVIVPACAKDDAQKQLIDDVIATLGAVEDKSTALGINREKVTQFFAEVSSHVSWLAKTDATILPLAGDTHAAYAALQAVKHKVDDYFVRCRLAAFDARAILALNRDEKDYLALGIKDLTLASEEIRAFPLAHAAPARALSLVEGVNPAWQDAVATFASTAVRVLGGERSTLSEAEWTTLLLRFAPYEAWLATKPAGSVEKLGTDRLTALSKSGVFSALDGLFSEDEAQAPVAAQIASVERLAHFTRDLHVLANNFVSFRDFYERKKPALFQVGTLFLDQRSCELCISVDDAAKHAVMAPLSRAYLAYCDCTRPSTGEKRTIVAAFTAGDSDNLMVGRNGVFYDRQGRDWDATITKVVDNPISIPQAIWAPYKKLVRFVEEQVAKRATAEDKASNEMLTSNVIKAADAPPAAAAPPKKLDIGVVAALGVAVGGITAALGALLQGFFGLGIWMPLGLIGLLLCISGPSMLIAWLKLRQRNIGPLLDANGWAVNANAVLNRPLGRSLTRVAALPPGSKLDTRDPFKESGRPWGLYLALVAVIALGITWYLGKLDHLLPHKVRSVEVLGNEETKQ